MIAKLGTGIYKQRLYSTYVVNARRLQFLESTLGVRDGGEGARNARDLKTISERKKGLNCNQLTSLISVRLLIRKEKGSKSN